jgi:L-seryl-tRNA(Ser) seleniumtransferase
MRVHPSTYRSAGFATSPDRPERVRLARGAGVPLYEDAGSGQLSDLEKYGVIDEPVIRKIVASGVDVVSFSGDKLLGSAQAGLIVG